MLTAQGFQRKQYDEFVEEMEQKAQEFFGADVNLSDASPLGKFIKLIAYARAEENELAEAIYYAGFYDTAEGINLDHICKYIGIQRIQAQKAAGQVTFTVDVNTTVNAGVIVATSDGIEFVTTESKTASSIETSLTVNVEAVEVGINGNVPANTITIINTPSAGIQSVTNAAPTTGGREKETDKELRDRYAESVAKPGSSTIDGIRAALLNDAPNVRAAVVIENNASTADAANRPPHSFEAVILGGLAADIGKVILASKPAGIQAHGAQSVIVKDDSGNDQTIKFSYAQEVQIYVNIDITTDANFPIDGNALVKLEVVKYIGGTDADGNIYSGLGMGDDVIQSKLINAIFKVPGVVDAIVTTSTDNVTFTSSNKAIDTIQVAQTSHDKVVMS